ncbi:hypothetical protein ACFY64_32025 [Streptomyces collinus]|uniref:hypothetical protein n=1 Tax=Streptomyces collinus TaxID=42684 RepID=UPI003677A8FD
MTGTAATLTPPVDGSWMQSAVGTWAHALNSADRVWEVVTEQPAITVPRAGIWVVSFQARGVAALPANMASNQGLGVIAGLYKDGALIPGSEAMAAFVATGANAPIAQMQATGTRQFVHPFTAGQTVQLAAYRVGQVGVASVVSNGDGRSYVTAHWIAPPGDGPS